MRSCWVAQPTPAWHWGVKIFRCPRWREATSYSKECPSHRALEVLRYTSMSRVSHYARDTKRKRAPGTTPRRPQTFFQTD